ncbi:MAG: hypothetical protein R3185_05615, partial [Candidatus Thermoplasmatota archaeon]|nr:hypothetical protein [Candidatus Thermoplasmatota archaeon]
MPARTTHRARLLAAGLLAGVMLLPSAALGAGVTLQLLGTPDVVAAGDYEGEERTTPQYLFSVQVRATNGEDARSPRLDVITYLDPEVTGCPERSEGVRPVT